VVLAMSTTKAFAFTFFIWIHVLAGITWIGLLYYFNVVQTPALATFEAGPRGELQRKLLPLALLWFRMSAAVTFLSGLFVLVLKEDFQHGGVKTWPGLSITAGMFIATVMLLNVWLVIWPNQKVVIANAEGVAAGRDPDPAAAGAARRGAVASRTNTLFSIPVIWFMISTSNWASFLNHGNASGAGKRIVWYVALLALTGVFEANALGLFGGVAPSPIRKYLDDHKTTIAVGVGLWLVFLVLELILS
jgi:uncharacterized membrane protein